MPRPKDTKPASAYETAGPEPLVVPAAPLPGLEPLAEALAKLRQAETALEAADARVTEAEKAEAFADEALIAAHAEETPDAAKMQRAAAARDAAMEAGRVSRLAKAGCERRLHAARLAVEAQAESGQAAIMGSLAKAQAENQRQWARLLPQALGCMATAAALADAMGMVDVSANLRRLRLPREVAFPSGPAKSIGYADGPGTDAVVGLGEMGAKLAEAMAMAGRAKAIAAQMERAASDHARRIMAQPGEGPAGGSSLVGSHARVAAE